MNYLSFLTWILSNANKIKLLLAKLQEIAELFTPADVGTLGISQEMTVDSTFLVSPDEEAIEAQVLTMLAGDGNSDTLAVRDGSRLRKLFATLGPLLQNLPTLIALFGSFAGK